MAASAKKTIWSAQALTGNLSGNAVSVEQFMDEIGFVVKCTALGSGTSLALKIQHSHNGIDWFDLVTFTAITSAPATEYKIPAVNVMSQVRVTAAFTGGTTTATVTMDMVHGAKGK